MGSNMFIGHFGVGLAAKRAVPHINLCLLFIACQLLDLIWPVLVLLNIEQVSVDHSATVVTPLNFSHYPFSHSLVTSLFYSAVFAIIGWGYFKSARAALVLFGLVFSHWILDFVTHRPDLPIFLGDEKFGLGLWNSLMGTILVEAAIFIGGVLLYIKASPLLQHKRAIIVWGLIWFLVFVYAANIFGPKAPEGTPAAAIAGPAMSMWLIVIWAFYADRKEPLTPPKTR